MSTKQSTPNRLVLVLVGVALVGFVGVVAFLSAGEGADLPSLDEVAGTVTFTGDPIPVPYPDDPATPTRVTRSPAPTPRPAASAAAASR